MRDMSTDRPDKTESAYTVDAGHFQVEADLLGYSYDRHNTSFANERAESWNVATLKLKVGLCNSTDLQFVVPTYNRVRLADRTTGTVERNSGFGDIATRLKVNVWGNDGGTTALALM